MILYLSRATSKDEEIWDPRESEALAVIWACEELRPYLISKPFTLITDHANLKWIMHTKHTKGKLAMWAIKLSEYDFDTIHNPGRAMTNADALSHPFPKRNRNQLDKAVENGIHWLLVDYAFPTRLEIASAQKNDPGKITHVPLRRLIDFLESDVKLCDKAYKKQLVSQSQHLIQEGLLYHVDILDYCQPIQQVMISNIYKKSMLYSMHSASLASHTGRTKTYEKLRQRFFWVGI